MTLDKTLKYLIYIGTLGLLFTPFIVFNSFFFPYITSKAFVFRIVVEVIFVLWLLLAFRNRNFLPRFSWILGALLIFVAVIGVADIFAINPYKAFWSNFERMDGFITLIHMLMYFIVVSSVFITEKLWKVFLNVSVASSLIMCIYGFLQLGGKIGINQGGVRLDGTLGNAIYLAVYMLFNIYFAGLLFFRSRMSAPHGRYAYLAVMLLQIIILYYTATRGVILGLVGGVFVSALYIAIFDREHKKVRRGAIAGLVVVVLMVGGFFLIRNTSFVQNSTTLDRFASLSLDDIKGQGRYFVWPMAISGFKENPILGWGQEGFNYVFSKYYNPAMYTQEPWFDRTHNIFLDWLVAGGLLGLLSYISIFVFLVFYLWRSTLDVKSKAVLFGLIAAYVFQNIFAFDNLTSYMLFFTVLAFIHFETTKNKQPVRWLETLSRNKNLSQNIIVPVVGLLMIGTLYFANVKPILANMDLLQAATPDPNMPAELRLDSFRSVFARNTFGSPEGREQMLVNLSRIHADGVDPEVRRQYEQEGVKQFDIQIAKTPYETRQLLFYGSFLNRLSRFSDAIPVLEKALQTSPKKQTILFELGVAESNSGKPTQALETFKQAYDLEPAYNEAAVFYALAALYAKKLDLAETLLKPVPAEQIVFDDRIVGAYAANGKNEKATQLLQARIQLDPKNPQHYSSLASFYLRLGNRTAAVQILRKALETNPQLKDQIDFYIKAIQSGNSL